MSLVRHYEETHPWITFEATDVNSVLPRQWMLLGEAQSKCEHLAGTPLQPRLAHELYTVTLIKGALATTAIEGNTLNEEQARGILNGTYKAPASRQYQEQEVRNVLDALEGLHRRIMDGENIQLNKDLILDFNRQVLKGLDVDDDVIPGEIRTHSVAVASYRSAPAEDCAYLLDRLSQWLNGPTFIHEDPEIQFALIVAKAVYAHLYLAWIHPFGDGNGRTARLVEFLILASCGLVPMPGAHLLSNHYNLTRPRYYQELARASEAQDAIGFLNYAIEGFIDGIREVIDMVREQQILIAWINFVHENFASQPTSRATERQRSLVLAMPIGVTVPRSEMEGLTPKVAKFYANAGPRMLSRDLNHLEKMGLIRSVFGGYENQAQSMLAFRPPMASTEP